MWSTVAIAIAIVSPMLATAAAPASGGPLLRVLSGGGNVGGWTQSNATTAEFAALVALGADSCRTPLTPGEYLRGGNDWDTPTPESLDAFMTQALAANITPMILLEYYAPQFLPQTNGFGTLEQWRGIGAAFATYLQPGGTWAKAHGAPSSFGVIDYSAINEPDLGSGFTNATSNSPGPAAYAAALRGFGEGVHSASPLLRAFPGGLGSQNAYGDCTCRGLAARLAPLWTNGTLDGVDLHTYFDAQYAPLVGTHRFSAQATYDCVLAAGGVPAAVRVPFLSTEFNFKERIVSAAEAARGLFTAVFDNVGVASRDGSDAPVALRAFPWSLFDTAAADADYGMAQALAPAYVPTARGCAYSLALRVLALGWSWARLDPRGTGVLELRSAAGRDALLVVWHNVPGWSSLAPAAAFTVAGLPAGATAVAVYAYDGLRTTAPVPPGAGGSVLVQGLAANETYVFLAAAGGAPPPLPPALPACT